MPLYEYRCAKCGKTFEKIQKFSDRPKGKCPECGGSGKRQLSAPAIRFKGTGWYVTDYGGKGKSREEKSEEKKASASESSESSKSSKSSGDSGDKGKGSKSKKSS